MTGPQARPAWETSAPPLLGVVLGAIGLLVGELLLDGAAWPWFAGLVAGLLIGTLVPPWLRRREGGGRHPRGDGVD